MVEGLNSTTDIYKALWLRMRITPSSLLRDEFENELWDFGGAISIGLQGQCPDGTHTPSKYFAFFCDF